MPGEETGEATRPEGQIKDDHMAGEKFDANIEYWLSSIGFAVGFGNLWRFPYMLF